MAYEPVIALSAKWYTYPERFDWIKDNGFALEYSPNPESPGELALHITPFLETGIPVRYHAFFQGYEIGHPDENVRERAMQVHRAALRAMRGRGELLSTVHVGLNPEDEILPDKVVGNLTRLVEYAGNLDITICLENLRRGPTSDPEVLVSWAKQAGAMITLDIGHALGCRRVKDGELSILDFFDMVSDRLREAHVYERETDRHYPPQDMSVLAPIVDRLLGSQCSWWTIELDDYDEALSTRRLLQDYIYSRKERR
ncbi:sugar phosphate isomerase/epimerase family protein [Chloroflexota bacterium]